MKLVNLSETKIILGNTTRTSHSIESDGGKARIPKLWEDFLNSGMTKSIPEAKSQSIYAVYDSYESDMMGLYTVTLGAESDSQAKGFEKVTIPTGNYLVFESEGPSPDCTIKAWQTIWDYFASNHAEHKRAFTTDFEVYTAPSGVQVYISIL